MSRVSKRVCLVNELNAGSLMPRESWHRVKHSLLTKGCRLWVARIATPEWQVLYKFAELAQVIAFWGQAITYTNYPVIGRLYASPDAIALTIYIYIYIYIYIFIAVLIYAFLSSTHYAKYLWECFITENRCFSSPYVVYYWYNSLFRLSHNIMH